MKARNGVFGSAPQPANHGFAGDAVSYRVSYSETIDGLGFPPIEPLKHQDTDAGQDDRNAMHESAPHRLAGFTDSAAASEAEQRSAPRLTMLIRAAKLICQHGEFLCVLRDVSETGISVRLFHKIPHFDAAILENPNGDRHELTTVWLEDGKAGFSFAGEVDFERFIGNRGDFSKRVTRVNLQMQGRIQILGRSVAVEIQNISQQGAQIATTERLAIDQKLTIGGEGLPDVRAKVRWRKDGAYGLVFDDTFQLGDMARIVAEFQLGSED